MEGGADLVSEGDVGFGDAAESHGGCGVVAAEFFDEIFGERGAGF